MISDNIQPSDIRLIKMANYVLPVIKEEASKDWVLNGRNNSFYKYLIERRNGSVTNGTLIDSYCNLIYGNGLVSNGDSATRMKVKQVLKATEVRKIIADFYLFGQASCQVIKTKGGDLSSIQHLAKEKVAPNKADDDGDILSYWVSDDWSNVRKFVPVEYPAFGTTNAPLEIYDIKPYQSGNFYFSNPTYIAGLPYTEMEEQIGQYSISHIKNGLSFGYIINVPLGATLSNEEKDILEANIKNNLVGSSNAGKFIIAFNGADTEVTVIPIQVNDAHKQWEFLTNESRQQIMTAHKVTSPMLFGIKDNTGLGNNANELDEAEAQLLKRVIKPLQGYLIEAFEEILAKYGIYVNLKFRPLTEVVDDAAANAVVSTKMEEKKKTELELFIELGQEMDLDYWEEIDNTIVHTKDEFFNSEYLNNKVKDIQFANSITGFPNAPSEDDLKGEYKGNNVVYKVRYQYDGDDDGEREFCDLMTRKKTNVYRKEDIEMASTKAVNPGFGIRGADNYDIFLYKGGVNCHHFWRRVIYANKDRNPDFDIRSPFTVEVSPSRVNSEIGKVPPPLNPLVYTRPIDMPNKGAYTK